jgi:Tol biopolymer transport system component
MKPDAPVRANACPRWRVGLTLQFHRQPIRFPRFLFKKGLSMRASQRPASVLACAALMLLALALTGCSGVRQDRTITWSADGESVGFQHDTDGVFVAGKGGVPEKIFQPDPGVWASSTPLWSPVDRRLIFTTARSANGQPRPFQPIRFEANPEGELHPQQPILYTCWLREAPRDGKAAPPTPLFEAACDHLGYVSASLAVRWDPKGERIIYLQQARNHQHALYAYDLKQKTARPVFPTSAEAITFDWTPDGSHLVCVLGNNRGTQREVSIWIGKPGQASWWQVASLTVLPSLETLDLLEQVRAMQPVWSKDGTHFAFVAHTPDKENGENQVDSGTWSLWRGLLSERRVECLSTGREVLRDLRWSPDGKTLGLVRGRGNASLHLLTADGPLPPALSRQPVRAFAGWNSSGDRLAYIVGEQPALPEKEQWAFLLLPDPLPRDAVYLVEGNQGPGDEVFSGMRVTFPRWSPKEDRLSLWFTFSPIHRSLFSRSHGQGLARGDPAALYDVKTGTITWMAVNAFEKAQVGHYYLLKRDYAEAWKWYAEAEEAAAREKVPVGDVAVVAAAVPALASLFAGRDFSLFEYHCLNKLGRKQEAQVKLEQLRRLFAPGGQPDARTDPFTLALLRDLYTAEVFLSIDAPETARDFFQEAVAIARTEADRLSSALVLGQLLLLDRELARYAELTLDTVMPLLVKRPEMQAEEMALLPLYTPEYLELLPEAQVAQLVARAETQQPQRPIDLFLRAAYQRLGRQEDRDHADARIRLSAAGRDGYQPEQLARRIQDLRAFRRP